MGRIRTHLLPSAAASISCFPPSSPRWECANEISRLQSGPNGRTQGQLPPLAARDRWSKVWEWKNSLSFFLSSFQTYCLSLLSSLFQPFISHSASCSLPLPFSRFLSLSLSPSVCFFLSHHRVLTAKARHFRDSAPSTPQASAVSWSGQVYEQLQWRQKG